jgi:hypothetical protein
MRLEKLDAVGRVVDVDCRGLPNESVERQLNGRIPFASLPDAVAALSQL